MTGANFLSEEVKGKSEEVEIGREKGEGMEALPYTGSLYTREALALLCFKSPAVGNTALGVPM